MRPLRLALVPVKRCDHLLGRAIGPMRVLVDVRTPMNLAVLRPVWNRLREDRRIALTFTAEDVAGVAAALASERLGHRLAPHGAVRWRRFDLSISADAWNHAPLRRCRSRLNFFHGVAGKYDLDDPCRIGGAGLESFDRIAFINRDRLEKWVSSGVIARDRAVLVGYPKLDDLLNGRWSRDAVLAAFGLDRSAQTVLYAPTFSTAGSLHATGEAIVSALLASNRNVVVKLHDRSLVPSAKYTGGVDWRERLRRFDSHPAFRLAAGADAGPLLAAADILLTDHSSIGFEFALLDRPMLVFDAPALRATARVAADKWHLLRSMADVVTSVDALVPAADRATRDPGRLRRQRAAAGDLFAYPGQATPRALAVVYELLGIRAPAARATVTDRRRQAQPVAPSDSGAIGMA